MFIALYRVIAFCIVCGVMIALAAVMCAAVAVSVLSAVVYGLASRKRTVRSALQALPDQMSLPASISSRLCSADRLIDPDQSEQPQRASSSTTDSAQGSRQCAWGCWSLP